MFAITLFSTSLILNAQGTTATTSATLLIQPHAIEVAEKPWRAKIRRKSHFRWAFCMAVLQFANGAFPFETLVLTISPGDPTTRRSIIILLSSLILPACYWAAILYSLTSLGDYKKWRKIN
jgi:hypothetical protein